MPAPARRHQVAVLALPGVLALDFGIPVHAFGTWDGGPYAVTVCTEVPGPVRVEGAPALLVEQAPREEILPLEEPESEEPPENEPSGSVH